MDQRSHEGMADVRAYYDRQADREWYRLAHHRVEYAVTLRALRDTLAPGTRVLDVGGGPGRYAVARRERKRGDECAML